MFVQIALLAWACDMKQNRGIVHYPCGDTNPYNQLLANSLLQAGVSVEMRQMEHYTNPAKTLRWAWKARLVHFHWIQGLYIGRSPGRFFARSLIFLLVLAGLRLRGKRLVLTVHNLAPHEHSYRSLHRLVNISMGRLSDRLIVHSTPAALAVSREYLTSKKISVIEHIDYGKPKATINQSDARNKLKIRTDRKVLLSFGNIRPYKGVDYLINAAKDLDFIGCDIVIVGKPINEKFAADLHELSDKFSNVYLRFGELSDHLLSEYLIASDIVAFLYKAGLCSGAAHLTLTHEKPFLCSGSTAFQHFVEMEIAQLCDSMSSADICRAAELALEMNDAQWQARVDSYRQKCHPSTVGARLKEVYVQLLGRI